MTTSITPGTDQPDGSPPPEAPVTRPLRPVVRPPRTTAWERVRTVALVAVALLGLGYALWIGKPFLLPVATGVMLSFLLSPQTRFLSRRGVPPSLATAIVMVGFLATISTAVYLLAKPATESLQDLPSNLQKAEAKLTKMFRFASQPIAQIDATAAKLDGPGTAGGTKQPATVRIAPEPMSRRLTGGAAAFLEAVLVAIVLASFLLAGGERFLHKLIDLLPSFKDKRQTVQLAREVEDQISRYLFTVTLINLGLGAATATVLWLLGMPNPALWGGVAALANYIPYLGPLGTAFLIGVVALTSVEGTGRALMMPAAAYLLHAIEANFVTPVILGRRFPLNPVALLLGLLFWWHLWGVPGAILAVPMLVAIRVCCERIEPLKPLGSFLAH